MKIFNKKLFGLFIYFLAFSFMGCEKSEIAPPNQTVAFIKYYGHVANQKAADVKRTSDGGYLILGSTNSYSTTGESDIYLIKTDEYGNEQWSKTFGKAINGTESYSEEGVKIIVLPGDEGYVIAGNRTYIENSSGAADIFKSKIIIYQLDLDGEVALGPFILRATGTESRYREKITDIKLDTNAITGDYQYILTGYTTNVFTQKPGFNPTTDKTDILVMLLDNNFTSIWNPNSLAYGFTYSDYGHSVQVLPGNSYLIVGTTKESNTNKDNIRTIIYNGFGGISNTQSFGGTGYNIEGGYSALNTKDLKINVFAHITDGQNENDLVALQLDYSLNQITPNADDQAIGFKFYGKTIGNIVSNGSYTYEKLISNSIALISATEGYILSFSNIKNGGLESDIGLLKLDKNLDIIDGWPSVYGYQDQTSINGALDKNSVVMPVIETIEGTQKTELKGFAFTGTFGLGTNSMIGLIKINEKGNFQPK